MKKVFEIVKDGNINVARPAMQFLALLLGSKIHDMSAILFLVRYVILTLSNDPHNSDLIFLAENGK